MKKDNATGIVLLGIGAVTLYALTRKQKSDDIGVFPDAWGGGSATPATPETPPTPGITPIINFPEVPPYVEEQPPEWLFSPQMPYTDYTGSTGTHKKDTVTPTTYTTGDQIHPSIGPTGGFGGGGAGGRGAGEDGHPSVGPTSGFGGGGAGGRGADEGGNVLDFLAGVMSSVFSPANLAFSITPLGGAATVLGTAFNAMTKKDMTTKEKASTTTVAPFTGSTVSSTTTASPSEEVSSFAGAGADYTRPVDTTKKGSAVTTVYESGAYQTISQGQIVSAGSAGSTAPPASAPSTGAAHAASTGQVYSPPGSSLGGSTGTVMSKKSASILSGDSAAAKAWRKRYGGG